MKIIRSALPANSLLNQPAKQYDHIDSFQGLIIDKQNKLTLTDIGKTFFSSTPNWGRKLFGLRNKIVALFGLKTSASGDKKKMLQNFKGEKGERVGLFKVFDRTENEIILGEDDKHLNFRVSLYLERSDTDLYEKKLTVSTTVIFNNWYGRFYFFPVKPFHQLIVPAMLKRMIRQLEKEDQ